jgi:uncharacterized damage-inducible protein DinB
MPTRPHADRLLADLDEVRQELIREASRIPPQHLNWAPATGMKSYRDLLIEIGAIESENLYLVIQGKADWDAAMARVGGKGPDVMAVLNDLARGRAETVAFLEKATEEDLQRPIPLPETWYVFFGGLTEIEPEELFRWIVRHEYYHLGQIITMRWIQGHNPYGSAD